MTKDEYKIFYEDGIFDEMLCLCLDDALYFYCVDKTISQKTLEKIAQSFEPCDQPFFGFYTIYIKHTSPRLFEVGGLVFLQNLRSGVQLGQGAEYTYDA